MNSYEKALDECVRGYMIWGNKKAAWWPP